MDNKKSLIFSMIFVLIFTISISAIYVFSEKTYSKPVSLKDDGDEIRLTNIRNSSDSSNIDTIQIDRPLIIDNNNIKYSLDLYQNQKYTFLVDVINVSTIDYKLYELNLTNLNQTDNLITKDISYEDNSKINKGDILYKDTKVTLKVSVTYDKILDLDNTYPKTISLNLNIKYVPSIK